MGRHSRRNLGAGGRNPRSLTRSSVSSKSSSGLPGQGFFFSRPVEPEAVEATLDGP